MYFIDYYLYYTSLTTILDTDHLYPIEKFVFGF